MRVLDETRQQLGVMPLSDALRLAYSKGLDLIEIAPEATPPVCRILEYGKFQYEEAKKKKETHGRQPGGKTKELQLTPGIDPHDFAVKLNHAIAFLCEGMKVRIKLRFRGRQRAHKEFGFEVVNKFIKETARYGHADSPPKMLGDRDLSVMITPLPREKRGKAPRGPIPSMGPVDPPAANPTGTVL